MVREEFDSTLIRRGRNALTFSDMAAFAQTVAERPLLKLLEELPELARLSETKFHLAEITLRQRFRREAPSDQLDLGDEESLVRFAFAHNPDLRVVRWEQDAASAGVTSAAALSNPVARAEWLHVQSPADYGWGVGLEWAPPQPGAYGSGKDAAHPGLTRHQ